jgi:uncharacterized OsmC-like protein
MAGTGGNLQSDGGEKHMDFSPLLMLAVSITGCATVP